MSKNLMIETVQNDINDFTQYLNKLRSEVNELCIAYEDKIIIESNRNHEKYYFFEIKKKLIYFKQVIYTEQQPYVIKEPYIEEIRATHEKQWFRFPGTIICNIHDHSNSLDDIYVDYTGEPGPNFLYNQVCIRKQTREYSKDEIRYEYQKKYKDVIIIKHQIINKYENIPEYKNVLVKNFDKDQYNQDIKTAIYNINSKKEAIVNTLNQIENLYTMNNNDKQNLTLQLDYMIKNLTKQYTNTSSINFDNIDFIENTNVEMELTGDTDY